MKHFFALLLALLLLLPACAPDAGDSDARTLKRIGKALSLDLSAGTLERLENTHGGFHGDGRTAAEITLPGLAGTGTPYKVIEDRVEAIHWALDHARAGDVIVLCGKGHETYQEVGHEKRHMDEREIVADYLRK